MNEWMNEWMKSHSPALAEVTTIQHSSTNHLGQRCQIQRPRWRNRLWVERSVHHRQPTVRPRSARCGRTPRRWSDRLSWLSSPDSWTAKIHISPPLPAPSTRIHISTQDMHHLVFGINFQIHFVNLINPVSIHLLVHLSTHPCHHRHSLDPSVTPSLFHALEAQNLPFQQILPTLTFFSLLIGLPSW